VGTAGAPPSARFLAAHGLAAVAVLLAVTGYVGLGGYFFIDEAAVHAQLDVLEKGSWTVPRPFPAEDPAGGMVAMANSAVVGDQYAPFAKHPVHVLALRGADVVGGRFGVRLLSVLGTAAAALAAAVLAGTSRRRAALALWVTAAASPLLFDSQLVVAHALAAGVAGWLAVTVLAARPATWSVVGAAALAALGGLLRNEMVIYSGVLAAVVVVASFRARPWGRIGVAAACAMGGLTAYLAEPTIVRWALATDTGGGVAVRPGTELQALLRAARTTTVGFGDVSTATAALGLVLVPFFLVLLAWRVSASEGDHLIVAALAAGAVGSAVLFASDPFLVPGLLWAFPLIAYLVLLLSPRWRGSQALVPLVVFLAFGAAVAASQYEQGGGHEWGWRYVAVGMPLLCATLAGVLDSLLGSGRTARLAAVAGLGSAVIVAAGGVLVLGRDVATTREFLERATDASERADADWVVSLDPSFGRFAYPVSLEGRTVTAQPATAGRALRLVAADDASRVLLVWRNGSEPPVADLGPYGETDVRFELGGEYRAVVLERPR
jgi:hypothetical protein